MPPLDTLALAGEVLSWIGLGIGLPLLVAALLVRAVNGEWVAVEVAVIERDGAPLLRWFAGGDFHERPLRRTEPWQAGVEWLDGLYSSNDPGRIRIGEPPHLRRVLRTLGIVFVAVGVAGLVLSLLPLFL